MKFGLIGYGLWGVHHAKAIEKAPGAELSGISCSSQETFEKARIDFPETPVYLGYENLLCQKDIDAVDIVVPNHLHTEIGTAALNAGKDVLLEKPMALNLEDCDKLIEAARQNDRVLTIGHEFRISTQWGRLKTIIDEKQIGEPLYSLVTLFRHPYRPGSQGWRFNADKVGSWTLEEPVHFFDSLMWYFEDYGDPTHIYAKGSSKARVHGMYDNFSAFIKWPGQLYGIVTQTLGGFEHHQVMEIVGTKGSIRTWWSGTMDRTREPHFELKVQTKDQDKCEILALPPSGELFELEEELCRVVDAFKARKPIVSAEEARKRVLICIEAERSLKEGQEVELHF